MTAPKNFTHWPKYVDDKVGRISYDRRIRPRVSQERCIRWTIPISDLANELLTMIFHFGQAISKEATEHRHKSEAYHRHFEILASHVCRQWRAVAVQNPLLWTTVHFRIHPHDLDLPYGMASAYLERSRNVPVNLTVHRLFDINVGESYTKAYLQEESIRRFRRMVDIIRPHCAHLGSVNIWTMTPFDLYGLLFPLQNVAAPALQDLRVTCANPCYRTIISVLPDRFRILGGGAPRLSSVSFKGIDLTDSIPPGGSMKDLTVYEPTNDGHHTTWDSFRSVLGTSSRSLASLTIHNVNLSATFTAGDAIIHLPQLTKLDVRLITTQQWHRILSGLSVPRLVSLTLTLGNFGTSSDDTLRLLLAGPSSRVCDFSSVESLTLKATHITHQATLDVICRAFPKLTHLNISACCSTCVDVVLHGALGNFPWPKLVQLDVEYLGCDNTAVSMLDLSDLDTSRDIIVSLSDRFRFPLYWYPAEQLDKMLGIECR